MTKEFRTLGWILACSLCLKAFLWLFSMYAIQPDSQGYIANAAIIRSGLILGINPLYPPAYSAVIALFSFFTPNIETAGIIASITFSVLMLIPLYFLAQKVSGKRAGYAACLAAALLPSLNLYAFSVLTESMYAALVVTLAAQIWRAICFPKAYSFFLAGVLAGVIYLTRSEGIGYGFLLAAGLTTACVRRKLQWKHCAAFLIPLLALTCAYVVFLHQKTGVWQLTAKMGVLSYGMPETGGFAAKYAHNLFTALSRSLPELFPAALLIFCVIGIWFSTTQGARTLTAFIAAFIALPFLVVPVSLVLSRYFLASVPFLIIFLIVGLRSAGKWYRYVYAAILMVLAAITLSPAFRSTFNRLPIYEIEYKQTGEWLKVNTPHDAIIYSQVGVIDYYAQRERVLVRTHGAKSLYYTLPLENIRSLALSTNAPGYLVVQQRWSSASLSSLLDEKNAPAWLVPVYRNEKFPYAKVVVYKIEK